MLEERLDIDVDSGLLLTAHDFAALAAQLAAARGPVAGAGR
ncbi:hypothetical protein [Streptantibioticus silvisoli]|uniref:Carrier domain-containing protein n=1 Tax=Streptantibioticus silvisoli TaxID=2705255 RepID=A0ABT6VRQ8_9ACTN|nr:hypothetical protein [Streptantibioticus silvisoli]MDI5961178.1 hypothetical protein [Streptantibioticus silvisoli]